MSNEGVATSKEGTGSVRVLLSSLRMLRNFCLVGPRPLFQVETKRALIATSLAPKGIVEETSGLEVLEQGIPFSAASQVRTSHIDGRQLRRWNDVTNEPGSCLPSNGKSGANPTTNRGIRYTVGRRRIQPAASKQWTWTRATGAGGAEPAIFRSFMSSSPYMRCGERNKVKYLFGRGR